LSTASLLVVKQTIETALISTSNIIESQIAPPQILAPQILAPQISASNIAKAYRRAGKDVDALRDVSFEINQGESVSLLGKSGSGKTTLLNLLAGLDRVTSGELAVDGRKLSKCSKKEMDLFRQESIGVVFQQFRLVRHRTAFQNVELPLMIGAISKRERNLRVAECLNLVGLQERATHKPTEMSGGEQQRVAIARAISNRPKVILADEPTGNLDSVNAQLIMELLCHVKDETDATLVLITHDEEIASRYTNRVIRLADGRLISDSETKNSNDGSEVATSEIGR